jgi:corrinoid protein of di/trimethylamine methyltransferase
MGVSENRKREILDAISKAVVHYDEDQCVSWCKIALQEGLDAYEVTMKGLTAGMDVVGDLYARQEYFVPELLLCSDALYAGLDILRPHIRTEDSIRKGKLLIGVVEGDIHDIGKNLVRTMFEAAGWEVHDLGKDVRLDRFVEEQKRVKADLVGLSALMTTSMMGIEKAVGMLKAADPKVKILVGGAPLSPEIAAKFGADGYAQDAVSAVQAADSLIKKQSA